MSKSIIAAVLISAAASVTVVRADPVVFNQPTTNNTSPVTTLVATLTTNQVAAMIANLQTQIKLPSSVTNQTIHGGSFLVLPNGTGMIWTQWVQPASTTK